MGAGQRGLFADLEVKVDKFVAESGELVAKAHSVGSSRCWLPLESVKLLFDALVENLATWPSQSHIDVIFSSGDHLARLIIVSMLQRRFLTKRYLKFDRGIHALANVLVEALLCIIRQLECEFDRKCGREKGEEWDQN